MNHQAALPRRIDPLADAALIARLISEVTGRNESDVMAMLQREYRTPGSTVAQEVKQRGITPYMASEAMEAFYSESDAFLFESAVWNRNKIKHRMRRYVAKKLQAYRTALGRDSFDVLVIGDGPGFDTLEFARTGNAVTYHELPGVQELFAERLFETCGVEVRIITDRESIPEQSFDAVVCLDVLEHVDDPPAVVRSLMRYLRSDGLFIVHAPFYMIHPAYPTHLRSNRTFSGSLALYRESGLRLLSGQYGWNPLIFQRDSAKNRLPDISALRLLAIRISGAYFTIGRWSGIPFAPIHWSRRLRDRWFGK